MREPRRTRGSRPCPPRLQLCRAASPVPAPAPQVGSSNSPAGDGETYCCFLSSAHVPQLTKCRLIKFHAKLPRLSSRSKLSASSADARSPRTAERRRLRKDGATRRAGAPSYGGWGESAPRGRLSLRRRPPGRPAALPPCAASRRATVFPSRTALRLAGASWGMAAQPRGGRVGCSPQPSAPRGAHGRDRCGTRRGGEAAGGTQVCRRCAAGGGASCAGALRGCGGRAGTCKEPSQLPTPSVPGSAKALEPGCPSSPGVLRAHRTTRKSVKTARAGTATETTVLKKLRCCAKPRGLSVSLAPPET